MYYSIANIACEEDEHLVIYDLIDNKEVWRKYSCSFRSEDPYVIEFIEMLEKFEIKKTKNNSQGEIDTHIEEDDDKIYVYVKDSTNNNLVAKYEKSYQISKMFKSYYCFVSPFYDDLIAVVFPIIREDIESLLIMGIRME